MLSKMYVHYSILHAISFELKVPQGSCEALPFSDGSWPVV